MSTAGNNNIVFDPNEKENILNDLYESKTTVNSSELEFSGGYWDPEAERQLKERAAEINATRRLEKKIETKVYKRLIKELLKKI